MRERPSPELIEFFNVGAGQEVEHPSTTSRKKYNQFEESDHGEEDDD